MISALSNYESTAAAGILARAAIAIEDDANPAAQLKLENEFSLRKQIYKEVKQDLGLMPDDSSPESLEKITEVIDREISLLSAPVDVDDVLRTLGNKGQVPSDLYEIHINKQVQDFYSKNWLEYYDQIVETIRNGDQEQHFGPESDNSKISMVSLFSKLYQNKFSYKTYTLLVIGSRKDLRLDILQVWRIYPDEVNLKGAKDLVDLLKKFSDVFGHEFTMNGNKSKFMLSNTVKGEDGKITDNFNISPHIVLNRNGKKIKKDIKVAITSLHQNSQDGNSRFALTFAINLDKYFASLKAHA